MLEPWKRLRSVSVSAPQRCWRSLPRLRFSPPGLRAATMDTQKPAAAAGLAQTNQPIPWSDVGVTGTGRTVDWLIEVPSRQGAPPILRWRSSHAGRTHAHHQGASRKEACRMQNHVVRFRWCGKPPRLACPFRRPPLDSASLACGPAGLPRVPEPHARHRRH
jgi:hypothetical protein